MIGILGGTFDPVHFGHLRTALDVCEALALEQVRLIPCHLPPHRDQPVASSLQRVKMLEAAVQDYPAFVVDQRELGREGPSYSYDTLSSLRAEASAKTLCLLVGMDAFRGLTTWHRWRELIDLCHLVVMMRPGAEIPAQGELADFISLHRVAGAGELRQQAAGHLLFQPVTQLEISATDIRMRLAEGRSAGFLVPEDVREIINHEGLYQGRQ
ncbi:MAG: nicotinate-nucleotide adenylyltransferase [Gammaproteobacteria bacterium]|nr:nicotinate-nucleotide adenylyltransferase [Gammaproteobacteria bacterium]MDH3561695.1 nicotinate-nucleotide adenylyltransferase [Gammaproteobacteria bacterium]